MRDLVQTAEKKAAEAAEEAEEAAAARGKGRVTQKSSTRAAWD